MNRTAIKKTALTGLSLLILVITVNGQVNLKKKAEKKADQVIDNFLFGKKKKKQTESNPGVTEPVSGTNNSFPESERSEETFTPEPVNVEAIDLGKSIPFRTLIHFLPEATQGYQRIGKPEGSTMKMQGISYSVGQKKYSSGYKELEIVLYDYLGAENYATAMTAGQYEYESTEGYSKSVMVDEMNGWVSQDYSSKESNLMLFKDGRFWLMISGMDLDQATLVRIAKDVELDRLMPIEP